MCQLFDSNYLYQLCAIYCNKIQKVIVYCYKIFKAVNCLLQQHTHTQTHTHTHTYIYIYIYIYIYHCIKISCGTLDMMRWSPNSSAPNRSVIAHTQPRLRSKTISRMDNTKHWVVIPNQFLPISIVFIFCYVFMPCFSLSSNYVSLCLRQCNCVCLLK